MNWLKRLECRVDAWAATKLGPEAYAEAASLDAQLKLNFWAALAIFALVIAVGTVLVMGVWPRMGWGKAFFLSGALCVYLLASVGSAWYGYRKYVVKPAWQVFALFIVIVLGGAAVGAAVAGYEKGQSLAEMGGEKLAHATALALLIGIVMASILVGVSRLRLREATQRAGRLQAEAERERLARQGVQAELKMLQAQVEPHFLFNTLANVRFLVQSNSPEALKMLDHLIHYLRTALPEIRSESSTLGREGELARAYLEIIRMRMGAGLEIGVDIPDELASQPFPALMLMTLVENAIKHGVAPRGRGRVLVHARRDADVLRVTVADDGRGLAEPIGQGVGLANLRERLRAIHGVKARLELASHESGGTVATIEVRA